MNWLLICVAICKYAEINSIKILSAKTKINLNEVLDIYSFQNEENLSKYLKEYVDSRKKEFDSYYFNNNFSDSANHEFSSDKSYVFKNKKLFIDYKESSEKEEILIKEEERKSDYLMYNDDLTRRAIERLDEQLREGIVERFRNQPNEFMPTPEL